MEQSVVFSPLDSSPQLSDQQQEEQDKVGEESLLNRASWLSCYCNLTGTIIGSGILGMPHAFSSLGWIPGFAMVTVCGLINIFTLYLLSLCAKLTPKPTSFYVVAEHSIPSISWLIDLAVVIKCYGVATSYLVVVGDLMPAAMESLHASGVWVHRFIWIVVGFCFVAPLSCFESLDALKYTSGLSILFIVLLTFIVILFALPESGLDACHDISPDETCRGDLMLSNLSFRSLKAIPVLIFGYTCQQNLFGLVNEMISPTQVRVNAAIGSSTGTAWLLYIVVACFGYITYGNLVSSDLLKSYPELPIITAARILVSVIVACHYPLQVNPGRKSVLNLIQHFTTHPCRNYCCNNSSGIADEELVEIDLAGDGKERNLYQPSNDVQRRLNSRVYRIRFVAITVVWLGTSFIIAMSADDFGMVLSVVGATGSTIVAYILPGLLFWSITKPEISERIAGSTRTPNGAFPYQSVRDESAVNARTVNALHEDYGGFKVTEKTSSRESEVDFRCNVPSDVTISCPEVVKYGFILRPLSLAICIIGVMLMPICLTAIFL